MNTLFEIAKSGLASSQRSLSVTSNNIVNADTPGYTRQRVDRSPVGIMVGNRSVGLGVNISTATRLRSEMNDVLTNEKRQDIGFMNYQNQVFERLQAAMTTDNGGDLDVRISKLFDMFSELANDPQDMSVRNSLISQAQQLTSKFKNIDQTITDTSNLIRESAQTTLTEINTLLKDIYSLNEAISFSFGKGSMDSTSLDLRVQKLEELSKLVDFEQYNRDNGTIELRIGGVSLVDSEGVTALRSEINYEYNQFNVRVDGGKIVNVNGGELGAQIDLYRTGLPDLQAKIDQIAATVVDQFNSIHISGFGLNDATPRHFFNPTGITAGEISINSELVSNPSNIAASTISGEAGNGDLASQIADLRDASIIEGRKLIDFTIEAISTPGTNIYNLTSQIETREAEIAMLQAQQERQAGVNIDEELANMIQFQNAYQGAARVMSTAQTLYDTLLGIVN